MEARDHRACWPQHHGVIGQWPFSMALTAILIAAMTLLLSACRDGEDSKRFTQCFWSLDVQLDRAQEFYRDEERRCYGLRWDVPDAYYFASLGDGPLAQNFMLAVPVTKIPSYTSAPFEERRKIEVRSLLGDFNARAQEIRAAAEIAEGVDKTDRIFHGLDVYTKSAPSPDSQQFYLLVQRAPEPQMLIKVWARPGQELSQLTENHRFQVFSNVDDRVYVEYRLPRSELSELDDINGEIVAFIRSFMVD